MREYESVSTKKSLLELLTELNRVSDECNLKYYFAYGSLLGAIRHKGFIPWDEDIDIYVLEDDYQEFCSTINKKANSKYKLYSTANSRNYTALFSRFGFNDKPHHIIHIDIFPLVGAPQSKIGRTLFSKIAFMNFMLFYMKRVDLKERFGTNAKKAILARLAKIILIFIPDKLFILTKNKLSKLFPIKNSIFLYNVCGSYGMKEYIAKDWLEIPIKIEFESVKVPCPKEWNKYLTHMYGDYMTPRRY